eukprot:TRINITY_DN9093_c0_g1_i1.p1 TRINITY_DN9093_c0_g1~~TRINITY_DN9093_c0_g1_i1.p1  ORF type:complete len:522 (-),score=120.05 TRINITY_DN9093_c0_g1_i1:110-1573(-)
MEGEEFNVDGDHPKENCGCFGIYAPELSVAQTISLALVALQHRGQESCGLSVCDTKGNLKTHKGLGLVSQVFNSEDTLKHLTGSFGIGHTRYSTAGSPTLENTHPVVLETFHGRIAIAQNGNLTTHRSLRKKLLERGIGMFKESDVEVIAQLLAANPPGYDATQGPQWDKRIASFMHDSDGAYSIVILTSDAVFGCRDHLGMRPLCIGTIKTEDPVTKQERTRYIITSESCALFMVGATYLREVRPGEIVRIDDNGLHSFVGRDPNPALCIFEYVYFSRPDSLLEDQLIVTVRERLGAQLARESPADGDIVIGVPESSVPAAEGYAKQSGIPLVQGIVKNRYVHRTFIQPTQTLRKLGVSMKFTPVYEHIRGKRVVLIDDSIVRGNTIENLVRMVFSAGAKEVHVRVSSPPIRHPCFMGIDMSTPQQMAAHNATIDEICKAIGATSLGYLSHEGLESAVRQGLTADKSSGYCGACFNGKYPLPIDEW